jgi:hypothetical protein
MSTIFYLNVDSSGFYQIPGTKKAPTGGASFFSGKNPGGFSGLLCWSSSLLAESAETVSKALYAAAGVQSFLLTGVERVALVAYVSTQWLGQGRTGYELVAAAASYVDCYVFWMDIGFHGTSSG